MSVCLCYIFVCSGRDQKRGQICWSWNYKQMCTVIKCPFFLWQNMFITLSSWNREYLVQVTKPVINKMAQCSQIYGNEIKLSLLPRGRSFQLLLLPSLRQLPTPAVQNPGEAHKYHEATCHRGVGTAAMQILGDHLHTLHSSSVSKPGKLYSFFPFPSNFFFWNFFFNFIVFNVDFGRIITLVGHCLFWVNFYLYFLRS